MAYGRSRSEQWFYDVSAALEPGEKAWAPDLLAPPREWFYEVPDWWDEVEQHSIWIDDDGRAAGLIANFSQCYLNYGDSCVTPWAVKEDENFVYQGNIAAALGERIPVSILAATKGHNLHKDRDPYKISLANQGFLDDNFQPLQSSNDVMKHQIMYGRYKNTPEGIAFLGAIFPHVSAPTVHSVRASAVSPHWVYDRTDDEMIFTGAVFVNRGALPLRNRANLQLREIAASLRYTHFMAEPVEDCACKNKHNLEVATPKNATTGNTANVTFDVVAATDPNFQGTTSDSEGRKPELTIEQIDNVLFEHTKQIALLEQEVMKLIKAQNSTGEGGND